MIPVDFDVFHASKSSGKLQFPTVFEVEIGTARLFP